MEVSSGNKLFVYLGSTASVVLWGMTYIWGDQLLRLGIPVEYFVFVRVLLAGFILLFVNILKGYDIHIHRKDSLKFFGLALCEPLIYFLCEMYGMKLTASPTCSALIIATTPIFSLAAGMVFFHEKISLINVLGTFVCLGGIVMVTLCATTVGEYFVWGVLLLLVAVLAEVGHASFTKSLSGDYKPQVIVMYQFLIGAMYFFPLFLTKGMKNFDYELYLSWEVMRPILFLAVLCSSLAFSLWVGAIKNLGVAKSAMFQAIIPVVTALAGFLLGEEYLTPLQWGGIVLAVLGVCLSQLVKCSGQEAQEQ